MKPPELAASVVGAKHSLEGTEIHRRNGDLIEVIEAGRLTGVRIFRSRTKAGIVFLASVIMVGPSARVISLFAREENRTRPTCFGTIWAMPAERTTSSVSGPTGHV